jgi:hypothetical protein
MFRIDFILNQLTDFSLNMDKQLKKFDEKFYKPRKHIFIPWNEVDEMAELIGKSRVNKSDHAMGSKQNV